MQNDMYLFDTFKPVTIGTLFLAVLLLSSLVL